MTQSPHGPPLSPGRPPQGAPGEPLTPGAPPAAGAPPAPAAAPPVHHAPGTDLATDLTASLSWMWTAFTRNLPALLVPGIIYGALMMLVVLGAIAAGIWAGTTAVWGLDPDELPSETDFITAVVVMMLAPLAASLLALPVSLLWSTGSARAAAAIGQGERPSIGRAMIGTGRLLLTGLLVLGITLLGLILFYVPGIVFSFFATFSLVAAARGARPMAAIRESCALVKENLATVLVCMMTMGVIVSAAGMLVVTLVLAIPLAALFQFALYERLHGRELPEPRAEGTVGATANGTRTGGASPGPA